MTKKAARKGNSLEGIAANIKLEGDRRAQHDRDYPMCARLSKVRSDKAIIDAFLDWLREEKNVVLCIPAPGFNRFDQLNPDDLLMEYFDIDQKELEKERRKILEAQRRANGEGATEDSEAG